MLVRKLRRDETLVLTNPDGGVARIRLARVRSGNAIEVIVDAPTHTVGVHKPEPSGKEAPCAASCSLSS